MKKLLVLALAAALSFTACAEADNNNQAEVTEEPLPVTCVNGTLNTETGKCLSCNKGWAGENCEYCAKGYFGENCQPVTCRNGEPNDGLDGDGHCLPDSCYDGWSDEDCAVCGPRGYGEKCKLCTRPYGQYDQATDTDCQFTDERDGEVYQVVLIGDQIWMGESLRYCDEDKGCAGKTDDGLAVYEEQDVIDVCPGGWHIPEKAEFDILIKYIKSIATGEPVLAWRTDRGGDNQSGFDYRDSSFNLCATGIMYKIDKDYHRFIPDGNIEDHIFISTVYQFTTIGHDSPEQIRCIK